MAGGTWIDQNKIRPGVYINYKSAAAPLATMGERGTVAIARVLDWATQGKFYEINSPMDCEKLNHAITDPEMLFIRQILLGTNRTNGAKKILVWSLETTGSAAASVSITSDDDTFVVTAKNKGTFGNRLSVVVTAATGGGYIVQTLLDNVVSDTQIAATTESLVANDYVTFSGTIVETNGSALEGGLNGTVASSAYSNFLNALETEKFDVLIYDGVDNTIKAAFVAFVKRMSNDEGVKCQAVISNYPSDSECVISVYPQSLKLIDGTTISEPNLTWWVGGCTAGATAYQSITYAAHPEAADVTPKLTATQQETALSSGNIAFIAQHEKVQVLSDINSFTNFTVEKGKVFSKNRVIRTIFGLCNDIYRTFAQSYIGAVHNDDEGRKSLKAEILNLMLRYQGNRALQNVVADDVTVERGVDIDAVVINLDLQPVDSVEKIYIQMTIS